MNIVDFDDLATDEQGRCALNGCPYTGLAIETFPDGGSRSEAHFREGLMEGAVKEWYHDGQIESDEFFHRGLLHGACKSWYPNGQICEDGTYQYGICLARQEWDEAGELVSRYRLRPDSADFNRMILESRRNAAQRIAVDGRPRCQIHHPG